MKCGINICIPSDKRVLVIEDNQFRIGWFYEHLNVGSTTYCQTKKEGLAALKNGAHDFDIVFLDHDSGPLMWREGETDDDTFYEVAKRLADLGFSGVVVIHSLNVVGAERLRRLFGNKKDVWVLKFGTFDITPGSVTI